jgi:hypothetical protein
MGLGVVLVGVHRFLGAGDFQHRRIVLYPIVYPMGRRVGDAKIDYYLVVVVTVGTPSVLPSLREVVDNLERLGLRFVIVSWNPLPLEGVDVLLVPWEGGGTKYGAIRWFVKSYA